MPYKGESQFKYIKEVGFINKRYVPKLHEDPYSYPIDPIAQRLLNHTLTSAHVRRTLKNTKQAIMGYDRPPAVPDNSDFQLAVEYFYEYISQYIKPHTPQYHDLYVNMKSGAGWPLRLHYPSKGDVPDEVLSNIFQQPLINIYWELMMKGEMLPITKIATDKMRSYVAASYPYLILEKIYSQNFNEQFKNVPMSAYGFNFRNLGYHQLMSNFKDYQSIVEYDVRFWDKGYSLKRFMFEFRKRFLILDDDEEYVYSTMGKHYYRPLVLLPDGTVAEFDMNQLSGGENTTVDNTGGHILIVIYEIICGYRIKYQKTIKYTTLFKHFFSKLYSDDTVLGHDDTFSFLSDGPHKHHIFSQFGMTIDYQNPEKWKLFNTVVGVTFLGLTCIKLNDIFVYIFNYATILDSSCLNSDKNDPNIRIQGFMSMLELLIYSPYYNRFASFIRSYALETNTAVPIIVSQRIAQIQDLNCEVRAGWVEEIEL